MSYYEKIVFPQWFNGLESKMLPPVVLPSDASIHSLTSLITVEMMNAKQLG